MDYPDKEHVCPHCQRVANFDLCHTARLAPDFGASAIYGERASVQGAEIEVKHSRIEKWLVVFRCHGCGRASAFLDHRVEIPGAFTGRKDEVTHSFTLSYPKQPPRRLVGDGVPEAVRSFYEEGGVAEAAGARRAAAAMFRGAVEAICDALEVPRTGKNDAGTEYQRRLQVRVDDLASKGIDSEIVKDMHEARLVGNDSVHDGLSYSADELADIADLIAEAVQLAFVQPAERQAMREKRRQRRLAHRAKTAEAAKSSQ